MPDQQHDPRPLGLVVEVALSGRRCYAVASDAGMSATVFSGVMSGRVKPSADQRRRIAAALGRSEAELFGTPEPAATQ